MHHKPLTIDATLDTLDWLKETDLATRLETALAANATPARTMIAEGKVRTYNMSGRRGDTDSPHHGGQAVAREAKMLHST